MGFSNFTYYYWAPCPLTVPHTDFTHSKMASEYQGQGGLRTSEMMLETSKVALMTTKWGCWDGRELGQSSEYDKYHPFESLPVLKSILLKCVPGGLGDIFLTF